MRIERLSLDFFGHFTGKVLDFGKAGQASDFHVIYGSNEAGKTTTMEAYLRLLYGFPHREPYQKLLTQPDGAAEILLAVDASGTPKQIGDMSKGTRFQLYLALRAAAYEQMVAQGVELPFFCDDVFETFDEDRTRAACRLMERIGRSGQAIYLTHHRHVVEIAKEVCDAQPVVHEI